MTKKKDIFISLGSNQGNRLTFLIKAICFLESYDIKIQSLSRIYETPPWGFESAHFYNACAQLQTELTPQELMETLLSVEEHLGRSRTQKDGYAARTIDLDLLSYEDLVLSSEFLTLPHPRIEIRNFVLFPLEEIAKKWMHPILNSTISKLKQQSLDTAICKPFPFSFWSPPIFESYSYIAIEGNIGIGKSTLTQKIGKQYKAEVLLENYTKNPYLELFYREPKKYAFEVETFFLKDRLAQTIQFWEKKPNTVVSDYFLNKSLVFAAQNLTSKDFTAYKKEFSKVMSDFKTPSLLVYLQADVSHVLKQIRKRGRTFEQEIKEDYLKKIEQGYKKLMQNDLPFPLVEISLDNSNFEADEADFQSILREIYKTTFL